MFIASNPGWAFAHRSNRKMFFPKLSFIEISILPWRGQKCMNMKIISGSCLSESKKSSNFTQIFSAYT